MSRIPNDITQVIREIDEELKVEGVSPVGRPVNAIMKFAALSIKRTKNLAEQSGRVNP